VYQKELEALERAGRLRKRQLFAENLVDLASNDYLGLARRKKSFDKAVKLLREYDTFAPRASQLVNGYHPIHRLFELEMCEADGFEEGMIVGSGFLANLSLIEALVRKGDVLFMDEEYHASGQLAAKLHPGQVVTFAHNDAQDLRAKMAATPAKRRIVAVEGVYSMSGEVCAREIFEVCDEAEALLIVDEAHSSGVLGERLRGVFEHYGITPHERHVKMGTLGKAYGSYGAYILASKTVIRFLENRAKAVIYATAPSLFDTALALVNLRHMLKKASKYRTAIEARRHIAKEETDVKIESLILPVEVPDNDFALFMQEGLLEQGYIVGAIRPPTVARPMLRVILNAAVDEARIRHALRLIKLNLVE
jgi:8-amino-7-oxononanoate synthase